MRSDLAITAPQRVGDESAAVLLPVWRDDPIVILPRRIPGGVAAGLDALAPGALPELIFEGTVPALRMKLKDAVADRLNVAALAGQLARRRRDRQGPPDGGADGCPCGANPARGRG